MQMNTETKNKSSKDKPVDGYISRISVNGKVYALKCDLVITKPITCTKCGAPLELKYGHGTCSYCGTHYSTNFRVEESDNV